MSWTQPICEDRWWQDYGNRVPNRMRVPEVERCCYCGRETTSGIYIRVDPATVPFPTADPTATDVRRTPDE